MNPEVAGAEVFTHEVARRLVSRDHDVDLFTSRFSRNVLADLRRYIWDNTTEKSEHIFVERDA